MRDYDISLIEKIREKQYVKNIDGLEILVKRVPEIEGEGPDDPMSMLCDLIMYLRVSGCSSSHNSGINPLSPACMRRIYSCCRSFIRLSQDRRYCQCCQRRYTFQSGTNRRAAGALPREGKPFQTAL